MGRCLKVLNLLVEKKVAEVEGDKLKAWEYLGMTKYHIEKCPHCRKLLLEIYKKTKISDVDFSQSPIDALLRPSSSCKGTQEEGLR